MKIIILRGLPGSGKSTLQKERYPSAVVVSADHFFMKDGAYKYDFTKIGLAHQDCWRRFYEAVAAKAPLIVVDNTNIGVEEISPYVLPAQASGYEIRIITINIDPFVAFERNIHGVKREVIGFMTKKMIQHTSLIPPYWSHEIVEAVVPLPVS